jgi:hypothetical protein
MSHQTLPTDEEVQKIRKVLEGIDFPTGVVSWRFEVGEDWTGDPAVRIWLLVDEDTVQKKEVNRVTMASEQMIRDALTAASIQRWPYVRVRSEAEQRALDTASR